MEVRRGERMRRLRQREVSRETQMQPHSDTGRREDVEMNKRNVIKHKAVAAV